MPQPYGYRARARQWVYSRACAARHPSTVLVRTPAYTESVSKLPGQTHPGKTPPANARGQSSPRARSLELVPHQLPAGLRDGAGERWVDGDGVGQLVDRQMILHRKGYRQDQLARPGGDDHPADDEARGRATEQLDESVPYV